jgi:hypothetical protein
MRHHYIFTKFDLHLLVREELIVSELLPIGSVVKDILGVRPSHHVIPIKPCQRVLNGLRLEGVVVDLGIEVNAFRMVEMPHSIGIGDRVELRELVDHGIESLHLGFLGRLEILFIFLDR